VNASALIPGSTSTDGPVAVTGARGFIGRRLCADLVDAGWAVVAVDLRPAVGDARLTEVVGDAGHKDIAGLIAQCPTIVHLAGLGGVAASFREPTRYWETNVGVTRRLLEAIAGHGQARRVILFSSSSVYGPSDLPASEGIAPAPRSPYGTTKLVAEVLAKHFSASSSARILVLRPFSVYGERQRPDMALARMIAVARERRPFPCVGPPDSIIRDWTYVGDVSTVVMRLLAMPCDRWPAVLNVASGRPAPLTALATHVEELLGARVHWEVVEPRPVRHVGGDISLLRELMPDFEATPLRDGIARQVRLALPARAAISTAR
jgi:UDP-glucuronate 4-epimerase